MVWLMAAAAILSAVDISIESDPPLPPPNLLLNGDIEQGDGPQPAHWRWATATPENFVAARVRQGRGGGWCLYIKSKSGVMSGYWSQSVRVKPGQKYVLLGWYRINSGRLLAYVHARAGNDYLDRRFYSRCAANLTMVPVFLKPEYVPGARPERWYPLRVEFTPPEGMTAVAVSVGMYFAPGEVWYDDLRVIPAICTLRIRVRADEPLRRVRVVDAGGKVVWDSGPLPEGARRVEREIRAPSTETSYRVVVETAQGQSITKTYPARAGRGGTGRQRPATDAAPGR